MLRNAFRLLLVFLTLAVVRYAIAAIVNMIKGRSPQPPGPQPATDTAATTGHLSKDPVCGTYVAAASSVTAQVGGKTVHYCSASCRDKHLEQGRA